MECCGYIGGGAGRAEGETAEEGAGRQGLRVHGARVCHGHDGAAIPPPPTLHKFAIPPPPMLHKFFASCGSWSRSERRRREGGREVVAPCVVGRVGAGLIRGVAVWAPPDPNG